MNTLNEVLPRLTVDQLKSLMRWLPDASPTGRKDLLVGAILRSLAGDGLRALWDRLDDIQRMAVAETAYAIDGLFDGNRFRAKYGRLPDFTIKENGRRYSYYGPPTALGLFLWFVSKKCGWMEAREACQVHDRARFLWLGRFGSRTLFS
jgi:hypothetical protein